MCSPGKSTTPTVGGIFFERVRAENCQACAGYVLGLPERPVKEVVLRDCVFTFTGDAKPMVPAMAEDVPACVRRGLIVQYADRVVLDRVTMQGIDGEPVEAQDVGELQA